MSSGSLVSEIGKQENDMPEPRLKQARLPFKTTTIKRSAPETGKKRKHEDDSDGATDKGSLPVYIDLTETSEVKATSQHNPDDDVDVKSTKVCIIQGESKESGFKSEKNEGEADTKSEIEGASEAVKNDKAEENAEQNGKRSHTSLQKWFKPKKSEVTSTNNDEPSNTDSNENKSSPEIKLETAVDDVKPVHNEPMEIDAPKDSTKNSDQPLPDESKKCNQESDSNGPSVDESADESLNVSIDAGSEKGSIADVSAPTTPSSSVALKKKLTPKQRQRREEMELRRQEKEKQKLEKEKKRLEEKEEKQRLKEEKEKKRLAEIEAKNEEKRQKEEERKAKEEERKRLKEEERRQKEEEKRQKEEERKQREEEKRQKEEERKQKEEEKRLKEEQKRQKEEHERKLKEKTAAVFTNFFLPKTKDSQKETTENLEKQSHTMFMPFEVKANMRLASVHRVTIDREKLCLLDEALKNNQNVCKDSLYLAQLKSKDYKPGHSENTWPLNTTEAEDDDDIMIVDDHSNADSLPMPEKPMRYRCKLLQFHENKRPAYWGTWRKRSKKVTGRTPFNQEEIFDYEVDSDEEWEDEPGESVDSSDDEKEPEDDYEVDNDVFVPHGYLSDEEAQNDDALDSSPKSFKLKLNILERQFEEEMKEKTHKLKPRVFGCIWINNSVKTDEGSNSIENLLLAFRAVFDDKRTPFVISSCSNEVTPQSTPSVKMKSKHEFPDSFLPDLVKLAHGSVKNSKVLAKEFNAYVLSKDPTLNLTLSCITKKLKEISTRVSTSACRLVNDEIKNQCGLADLSSTENTWKYITTCEEPVAEKIQKLDPDKQTVTPAPPNPSPSPAPTQNPKTKANVPSIAKFVKVLTAEEKQLAFNEIAVDKNSEKQTIGSPSSKQKKKPVTGITKFVKVLDSQNKNVNNELQGNNSSRKPVVTIDLTEDNFVEMKSVSESPTPLKSVAESSTLLNGCSSGSKLSNDNITGKSVNILIPRKVEKNPAVNILIPRKTPSRPITSPISARPFASLAAHKAEEPSVNAPILGSVNEVQKNMSNSKPVNVLIPRRAKDMQKLSDNANSNPVNVLIPRKATDVQNVEKNVASSPRSKPVNILIPRRAKDVQKKEGNENILSEAKCDNVDRLKNELVIEKAKDFIEDNASSDFSLSIESGDTSDIK